MGTFVLHAVLLALLLLMTISKPKAQEEGGVPVMLGNMEMAQGDADPYTLTDIDILDEPQLPTEVSNPEPVPEQVSEAEMITQEDEPTMAVPKKETPKPKVKKEIVKKETPKKEPVKPKEKTEAEKRAEAERLAAEKKAAEEKLPWKLLPNGSPELLVKEPRLPVKVQLKVVKACKEVLRGMQQKENLPVWVDTVPLI